MFKEKILPLGVAAALVGVIIFLATRGGGHDGLRIASSNDAAGTAVALAAGQDRHTTAVALADCCGAQAEIALEAGVFDMAVICPDAALVFLQTSDSFVLWGGVAQNANVLASMTDAAPTRVGYTLGRTSQREAAQALLGYYVEFIPMNTISLPYALARGAVDAAVLDVLAVINADTELFVTPLQTGRPSSVLIVHKDIIDTEYFNNFIQNFNDLIDRGEFNRWEKFYVNFLSLPEER